MSQRSVDAMSPAWMSLFAAGCLLTPGSSLASGYDPYAAVPRGPIQVDMAAAVGDPTLHVAPPQEQPDLQRLGPPQVSGPVTRTPGKLPPGWVQIGDVVQREEVAFGLKEVDPEPSAAWEDIEGNQYPRKGTLFLNFNGGLMYGGEDNSAENKSVLARAGEVYPAWNKGESAALAIIQRVKEDMSALGVRIAYDKRPSKMVPYTMAMVSGTWQDTNIDSPAGGVAPGTDCTARGQRHVVYVFEGGAATVGQEAAHSWGLDHTIGSDRIMSYQNGTNKRFGDNCQPLCENACQGPGSIGCRLTHEIYCGVGSEQQNDLAELHYIFGTNEPDTTPPEVKITEPADGLEIAEGESVTVVGDLHDDYGGLGWKLKVAKDGMVVFDEVDYEKNLSWYFSKMPAGSYEVTLTAEDHADHVVSDTIRIFVGTPSETTGPATSGDTGSGESGEVPTEGGSQSGGSSGGSEGSEASGSGSDTSAQDDGGCRISRGSGAGGSLALLVPLVGLGLRARRRRFR